MLKLPTWLLAGLNQPFQLIPKIEWSPDWGTWFPLRPLSGSHGQNRTQQARWSFSGTFAKDYSVGENGLHPYGPRVKIFLGIKTVRNPVYWVPQGQYLITSVEENEDSISVSGTSYEQDVIESDFVQTRRVPSRRYQSYRSVAEEIIREAVPDARFYWDRRLNYDEACPLAYFTSGRWGVIDGSDGATSIMGALGGEAFCDAYGSFRFTPVPTLDDAPVWRVAKGGALVSQTRTFDRADVFNVVGASGDAADGLTSAGPVYAWDNEPTSITYAGPDPIRRPGHGAGRFGVKPVAYSNPLIKTNPQAGVAARAQLANKLGLHYGVNYTARYHPGVEVGDVIEAETYDERIERHLLDTISYQWGAAEMTAEVRSPKEAFSTAALLRTGKRIAVSDEVPLPPPSSEGGVSEGGSGGPGSFTISASAGRSYQGGGASRATTRMWQGRYDATNGNQKSLISFNYANIVAALSGKTMTGCTIRFRVQSSYHNAGDTAIIGTHNLTSIPNPYGSPGSNVKSNRVTKGSAKAGTWYTVELGPAIANEFKAGTAKGIMFGPGPSTSLNYYMSFYIGGSNNISLTFSYSS